MHPVEPVSHLLHFLRISGSVLHLLPHSWRLRLKVNFVSPHFYQNYKEYSASFYPNNIELEMLITPNAPS